MSLKKVQGMRVKRGMACLAATWIVGCAVAAEQGVSGTGTDNASKVSAEAKRDPFWPVGYQPKGSTGPETTEIKPVADKWSQAMAKIVISGVSTRADKKYYAIINGQLKGVGDTVSVTVDEMEYVWVVDDVQATGSVKLRRKSAQRVQGKS